MTQSVAENKTEPVVAVVVAAGSGVRLGGTAPKALRELAGTPLLVHAARRLLAGGVDRLVVVVPESDEDAFRDVLTAAFPSGPPQPKWRTVAGGHERQESVRCGLAAIAAAPDLATARVVLIHDAARPVVPAAVVSRVIEAVRAGGCAVIPVVPVTDTIRQVTASGSTVVDREQLRAVQTPQGFDRATITEAHALVAGDGVRVTDDAAVCEYVGRPVTLVEGDRSALKITEPADLALAAALLAATGEGGGDA